MLSISHVATGAFVAAKISNPVIAIPLILAFHYLEDWIPHWDVGTGLSTGKRKKQTALILEVIELVIAFGIVFLFWGNRQTLLDPWIIIGAIMGIVPDLLEAPRNFLHYEPFWLKPVNEFHAQFHHSTPDMLIGLTPQVVLLIVIFLLK